MDTKRCSMCGDEKSTTEFHKDTGRKGGLSHRCKGCSSIAGRNRKLKFYYGVDTVWKKSKYAEQDGRCAVCGCELVSWSKAHVDHNHSTKEVRGLLCGDCNRGIGLLKDTPLILLQAAVYLGMYGKVIEGVTDGAY